MFLFFRQQYKWGEGGYGQFVNDAHAFFPFKFICRPIDWSRYFFFLFWLLLMNATCEKKRKKKLKLEKHEIIYTVLLKNVEKKSAA